MDSPPTIYFSFNEDLEMLLSSLAVATTAHE